MSCAFLHALLYALLYVYCFFYYFLCCFCFLVISPLYLLLYLLLYHFLHYFFYFSLYFFYTSSHIIYSINSLYLSSIFILKLFNPNPRFLYTLVLFVHKLIHLYFSVYLFLKFNLLIFYLFILNSSTF